MTLFAAPAARPTGDSEAFDLVWEVAAGLNDLDAIAARLKLRPPDGARTT